MSEIKGTMQGLRGPVDGELKPFAVKYIIETGHDGELWLKIENGPTGYVSADVRSLREHAYDPRPWAACMGTEGRWDRLEISRLELNMMLAILARMGSLTQRETNTWSG